MQKLYVISDMYFLNREAAYHYAATSGMNVEAVSAVPSKTVPGEFIILGNPAYTFDKNQKYHFQVKTGSQYYGGAVYYSLRKLANYSDGHYEIKFKAEISGDDDYSGGDTTWYPIDDDSRVAPWDSVEVMHVYFTAGRIELYNMAHAKSIRPVEDEFSVMKSKKAMATSPQFFRNNSKDHDNNAPHYREEQLSQAVQSTLQHILLHQEQSFSEQVKALGELSSREEELLNDFRDSKNLKFMDKPVHLNGNAYDLTTLTELINPQGVGVDPLNQYEFTISNISPAVGYMQSFIRAMETIHEERSLAKRELSMN